MKFSEAIDKKACLFAVSEDHSDFCGAERAEGNRNYCAEHAEKARRKTIGKKPDHDNSWQLSAWRSDKASIKRLKARGIG